VSAHAGRGVPRQSRAGAKPPGLAPVYTMLVLLLIASPALAQGIDVTASLDITDGWARVGAYVPVTFKVTNHTGKEIAEVFVTTGGPVDVRSEWRVAPGETDEKVLPIYYTGADLSLAFEFRDANGQTVALARVSPAQVRALPEGEALVAIQKGLPNTIDEVVPDPLRLSREQMLEALRCGILDVVVVDRGLPLPVGRVCRIDNSVSYPGNLKAAPFPGGVNEAIQPRAQRLFASDPWPVQDRKALWFGLALFSLAVLVAGVLLPRRRRAAVLAAMIVLGAGGCVLVGVLGEVRRTIIHEGRVYFADPGKPLAALEHFVCLESRGGAKARFRVPKEAETPFPLPVLASSEDLFRPRGALRLGEQAAFESNVGTLLLHILTMQAPPLGEVPGVSRAQLTMLLKRPDLIRALLVEGDRATDADGRFQTIDAWAVEWQGSDEPNVAYAGRSLKWWDSDRREGDGSFLLAWFHDPAPQKPPGVDAFERLPALVVYSEAPKAATRKQG